MNTEAEKLDNDEDDFDQSDDSNYIETVVMSEMPPGDSLVDTAELQVDKLIAQVEAESDEDIIRRKKVRQRLEELSEEMSLEDTYAFDIDGRS